VFELERRAVAGVRRAGGGLELERIDAELPVGLVHRDQC
jgi:hypothetical protein